MFINSQKYYQKKMNLILNYSPNFNKKKRNSRDIKFIIFHYTGMKKEIDAINLLTNEKSKVSSHYFIKKNGDILILVPELYVAWHAGISSWNNYKFLNKNSIGIEISNPGHDNNYKNFSNKQILSIIKLSKFLIKKYKIKSKNILGHSDIAPSRKKDPGEKFPWKILSKSKIGYWHDYNDFFLKSLRNKKINKSEKKIFFKNLIKIGYAKNFNVDKKKYLTILTKAFQRRFRQKLVNGIIDKECFVICKNIIEKL